MSTDINPEKMLSSLHRKEPLSFADKLKEIKGIVSTMHDEKANEVMMHLEELSEIYNAEVARDKHKYEKYAISEEDSKVGKVRKS